MQMTQAPAKLGQTLLHFISELDSLEKKSSCIGSVKQGCICKDKTTSHVQTATKAVFWTTLLMYQRASCACSSAYAFLIPLHIKNTAARVALGAFYHAKARQEEEQKMTATTPNLLMLLPNNNILEQKGSNSSQLQNAYPF